MINNQHKVENRRNWKGQVVDYDAIQDYENRECSYCLTDAQVAVLAGIIEPLAWTTRWQSDTQAIDPVWTEQFRNDIQRRLAMSCCGDDLIYRYTEDGTLQSSEDNGETWEDAPNDDIRYNAPQFPPLPGEPSSDKKCIAATGMSQLIKQQIGDQLTDDMSRYTLNQLIKDWTSTYIGTSNPFIAILTVAANQIFALIISVLRPALTDTVYDLLQCIFYCNIEDDLSFTEDGWITVRSDIGDQIGGIATIFLQQLIYLLGPRGLTNLARAQGSTTGDCSDCAECPGPCATRWHVYPDTPTDKYGTIIEQTDDYIIVESGPLLAGKYFVIVETGDDNDCCYLLDKTFYPGTSPAGAEGLLCGETFPTHGITVNQCVHLVAFDQLAPFTVKIVFSDCPP